MRWRAAVAVAALARAARAQPQLFDCPAGSCWCSAKLAESSVLHKSGVGPYRVAFNRLLQTNQSLYLDEWFAPSNTRRPGAVIIHGGGYSSGPYNGCSHARNMSTFAAVAMSLAVRGYAVISIDYRCEGKLRGPPTDDNFHPWYDAVEDARAAVRWMSAPATAARLQLDTGRIMAFGGSAGAVTVAQLLHALPDSQPMPAPPTPTPPGPPGPPSPVPAPCASALNASCPRAKFKSPEDCLACTRAIEPRPACTPSQRQQWCSAAPPPPPPPPRRRRLRLRAGAAGNVTCGIALSGAIVPSSIAAGQVTASTASPAYLDLHGTNDSTVPYDWVNAHGDNSTWGDAVDTQAWLAAHGAPSWLAPIPGAGHVPFGAVPPCASPAEYGCWNATFFGFLYRELGLAKLPCGGREHPY